MGINHFIVTQVDPTVRDVVGTGPEENQIARLRVLSAHVGVGIVLLLCRTRKCLANSLTVDVLCEAGTVKRTGTVGTVYVRLTQVVLGLLINGSVGAVTGRCSTGGCGVGVALLLQVAVPDPTGRRLTPICDVVVEVLHAVLLDDVTLLGGVPGRIGIVL